MTHRNFRDSDFEHSFQWNKKEWHVNSRCAGSEIRTLTVVFGTITLNTRGHKETSQILTLNHHFKGRVGSNKGGTWTPFEQQQRLELRQ